MLISEIQKKLYIFIFKNTYLQFLSYNITFYKIYGRHYL